MSNTTYYQRNRGVIINREKDCYENNKEILREQAGDKYRNLSCRRKKIIVWLESHNLINKIVWYYAD